MKNNFLFSLLLKYYFVLFFSFLLRTLNSLSQLSDLSRRRPLIHIANTCCHRPSSPAQLRPTPSTDPTRHPKPQVPSRKRDVQVEWWDRSVIGNQSTTRMLTAWATSTQGWFSTKPTVTSASIHRRTSMVISNIARPYGAMIDDGGNSGFMDFGLLGLWVSDFFFFFFFAGVFGSSSHGFFGVWYLLWVWLWPWIVVEMAVCC